MNWCLELWCSYLVSKSTYGSLKWNSVSSISSIYEKIKWLLKEQLLNCFQFWWQSQQNHYIKRTIWATFLTNSVPIGPHISLWSHESWGKKIDAKNENAKVIKWARIYLFLFFPFYYFFFLQIMMSIEWQGNSFNIQGLLSSI